MADATALAEASEMIGKSARGAQTPTRVEASLLAAFQKHHRRASCGVLWSGQASSRRGGVAGISVDR